MSSELEAESLVRLFEIGSRLSFPSCASCLLDKLGKIMLYGLQINIEQESPVYVINNFIWLSFATRLGIVLGVGSKQK